MESLGSFRGRNIRNIKQGDLTKQSNPNFSFSKKRNRRYSKL